ncbi:hypothetical protein EVG20_g5298 [Dentipellis fragilis]|uniref:Uncharacterized protein n=1 Tax=Dentipellis fragilis TaxID=205917 RepID=A0A4Y9YUD6_9AGAM|nr:hypothetical protein EVG20_g5298 [Dentipellis fragilis]
MSFTPLVALRPGAGMASFWAMEGKGRRGCDEGKDVARWGKGRVGALEDCEGEDDARGEETIGRARKAGAGMVAVVAAVGEDVSKEISAAGRGTHTLEESGTMGERGKERKVYKDRACNGRRLLGSLRWGQLPIRPSAPTARFGHERAASCPRCAPLRLLLPAPNIRLSSILPPHSSCAARHARTESTTTFATYLSDSPHPIHWGNRVGIPVNSVPSLATTADRRPNAVRPPSPPALSDMNTSMSRRLSDSPCRCIPD